MKWAYILPASGLAIAGAVASLLWLPHDPSTSSAPIEPVPTVVLMSDKAVADSIDRNDPKQGAKKRNISPINSVDSFNDFQTASDLRELFDRLRSTQDSGSLIAALRILAECSQMVGSSSTINKIANGETTKILNKPISDSQIVAARLVVARCSGFSTLLPADFFNERQFLENALNNRDDSISRAYSGYATQKTPSDNQAREMLTSGDPIAIMLSAPSLIARWARSNPPQDPRDPGLMAGVFTVLSCDLGLSCGESSLRALTGCIYNAAMCGLDVKAQALYWVAARDQSRFEDLRITFVQAIRSGDLSLFGLS